MTVLVEILVADYGDDKLTNTIPHRYKLTKSIEMPVLPPRSSWLTFGDEGKAVIFHPDKWEITWLDSLSMYRIECRTILSLQQEDATIARQRLLGFGNDWVKTKQ
jgi:hypothetical protein